MKSIQRAMLPNDENGEVLREMVDDGDDLTLPRDIDFHFVFATQAQAGAFAAQAQQRAETAVLEPEVDDEGVWQVTVQRHMPASHTAIGALEQELTDVARGHDGYPDGWSCVRVHDADDEAE